MQPFVLGSLVAYAVVVGAAFVLRSRTYAAFRAVGLGLHSSIACALFPAVGPLKPLFVALHAAVFVHSLVLVWPALRPWPYRVLVSIPSAFFSAGTLLGLPFAIGLGFGMPSWLLFVPYTVALIGVVQSLVNRRETVDLVVGDGPASPGVQRAQPGTSRCERPLKIVQITDPHLGPFMSVARLRGICERALSQNPDMVVLTGDFLTMESQRDPSLLGRALEPLRAMNGRVFACRGNHDHEAPLTVARALEHAGIRLLVDQAVTCETDAGRVQVVGIDYVWRNRREHIAQVCHAFPREPGLLRLVLLHDPGAFKHVPEGDADLVLSGHTHGGQVGLVSLGLPWTMLRVLMNAPDHGLWARGTDRLYVHRGTGHYGFPLRLGVPGEESLLRVHAPAFAKGRDST